MAAELKFEFPASAANVAFIHARYMKDVIEHFPCPEGFEELEYGYEGVAYRRDSKEMVNVEQVNHLNKDIGQVLITGRGVEFETSCVWYVKKK